MWNQVSYETVQLNESNLCQLLIWTAWKSQDFSGVWTHDLTISLRRSNQLSYEATDIESWSFVGPKELVRNEC